MSLDLQYDVIPWEPDAQKGVYCQLPQAVESWRHEVQYYWKQCMGVGGDCPGYTNNILQVSC